MSSDGGEGMNAIWTLRLERVKWWLRLGPFHAWRERRRVRRELLDTPGVDDLVRDVMDERYGKYGWRVIFEHHTDLMVLQAQVTPAGGGAPYWGPIGPLTSLQTRRWLTSAWLDLRGTPQLADKPRTIATGLSHAKDAPYKIEPPVGYEGPYDNQYADTIPVERKEGKQP